ncbi:ion transporter [Ferrimonas sediminicola]|uniref:Ion transporter n=1 Tax=Ferrimonas sediminicola TaxID=2569538 RepID=A0A4U1BIW2_9GAMM|nr:ion transporter [Ferrimonas sediminicola]TKB51446.1 ion transporter [Ferrimonas sediminicola]
MPKETLSPRESGMMLLSVLSVIVVLIIAFNDEAKEAIRLLLYVDFAICMVFIINFFWGLAKSSDRRLYAKTHWIDLVASIPVIEPLRFARIFQVLRVVRLMRMSRSLLRAYTTHKRETTVTSLLVALITVLTFSSVLILLFEDGAPGANINDAESAIWWSLVTISTVGYGDYYPVTTEGRIIGAMVIICGVSFFGIVAGYLASIFVSPEEQEKLDQQNQRLQLRADALEAKLSTLSEQNRQILARLEALSLPEAQAAEPEGPAEPGRKRSSP